MKINDIIDTVICEFGGEMPDRYTLNRLENRIKLILGSDIQAIHASDNSGTVQITLEFENDKQRTWFWLKYS